MALLLSEQELVGKDFIHFLVHQHPQLRQPIATWLHQVKQQQPASAAKLFLQAVPEHLLKPAQEEFIRQGKPTYQKSGKDASSSSGPEPAAMASQQPGAGNPTYQQLAAQQAQQAALANLAAAQGARPVGAAAATAANWAGLQQQRTVSPAPGQLGAAAVTPQQMLAAQLQLHSASNPALAMQLAALQQQQQQQQRLLAAQNQQLAAGRGRGAAGPAAPKKAAPGLASVGSAGNLQALGLPGTAAGQQAAAAAASLRQRPAGTGLPGSGSTSNLALAGLRPGGVMAGPGGIVRPMLGMPGAAAASAADRAAVAQVQQVMNAMRPNEAPKVEPPDGYEWVQCTGKDGKPGWFAVPRARAQAIRLAAAAKRKAEDGYLPGQPAAKHAHVAGRRRVDDDTTAGVDALDVLAADDLQAEMALNEAAKGAVVVEQGNVQEEYVLNNDPTMALVARLAHEGGVKQLSDAVYPYLSLAAEAYLSQLLNSLVKIRLQREDLGKSYTGAEMTDTSLLPALSRIRRREREVAERREQQQQDALAKLGATRKKLADEDKKAVKAAQNALQLQQQKQNLGTTLTKMGLGRKTFSFAALGRSAPPGGSKSGFTKPELQEAKAAATGEGQAAAAGTDGAAGAAGSSQGAAGQAGIKSEPGAGSAAEAQPAGGSSSTSRTQTSGPAAAAGSGVPALKPMTLQHQLLSQADTALGGSAGIVAGGASASRVPEGEAGLRELMLTDLIAVMERHPLYCRSQQLYALHALAGLHSGK